MKKVFIALRALTFMAGFVLFWAWIALSVRRYDPSLGMVLPPWTRTPGIFLMAIGAALAMFCVGTFIAIGRGTPAPFDPPKEFVAAGPYRYVRNPMYIGALLVFTGLALYQRSFSILLFSLAWLAIINLFVIYYEEPTLGRKFGTKYQEYCRAVPRWIPNLRPIPSREA